MLRTQVIAGEKYVSITDFKEVLIEQQAQVAVAGLARLIDPAVAVGAATTTDTLRNLLDTL